MATCTIRNISDSPVAVPPSLQGSPGWLPPYPSLTGMGQWINLDPGATMQVDLDQWNLWVNANPAVSAYWASILEQVTS